MLNYSFFNAILDAEGNPDRAFDANDFSKYFGTLIKNGIFPNPSSNFQIQGDQGNMSVKAERGLAWIEGHLRYDDSVFILNIDPADSVLDRIDRIVLRLDTLERCIKWVVKKGELSGRPVAASLQRDADAYEIGIADISVSHGIVRITQSMITDLRMNTELCGWITGTVTQIDTSTLFNQLEKWKEEYIAKTNTWTTEQENIFLEWKRVFEENANTWKKLQETDFTNWSDTQKQAFTDWFERIKGLLSTDQAGNLQTQIDSTNSNLTKVEARVAKLESERVKDIETTMLASKWQDKVYSFEDIYPASEYDFDLQLKFGATKEQIEAWNFASINGGDINLNRVEANGIVPKIDIPVIISYRKK